ncbi:E3 sumo-protein ligase 2-like protein [Mycena sanguinolenta]|uniref:E3 sumo-protein ligase 2-like protein n=1 Tax=Mycena sanguinolenta TaxID=230812 RepID=A0A8H7DDZ7_9AGAR|nr:E3 sumo-protein ligase 2-like protein [Mycena sanguinolenta]
MSGVIRSRPRRSSARSAASLPYSRPRQAPAKKSPWAIATGLLSFLNPLRLASPSPAPIEVDDDDEDDEPSFAAVSEDDSPPESLSARGRQSSPVPCLLPDSSSPEKNLRTVADFLEQRRGLTISALEAEGLISLINKSSPAEKPEPFRFSSSRPSTPARDNSPGSDVFHLGATPGTPASGSSPRKTLTKNPNGSYRWTGAGSARPSKNRYASPAFGASSRASSPRLVFQDSPSKSTEDASPKRRRLETPAATTPPPVPRSAAPDPSPNRVATSHHFPFPQTTTPTSSPVAGPSFPPITPNTMLKKTLPANPSPLRQAWGGSPASSISSGNSSPAQPPTKAASLLSALIRDVDAELPKRSADVRNPYQSASPVSIRVTNTHPPEPGSRKRTRATGRPAPREAEKEKQAKEKEEQEKKEKAKEKEVATPQAIIEATLPKGSKRSRPPANLTSSANTLVPPSLPSPRRSPRLEPQHIEVEEDAEEKDREERDAGAPATKRTRPNGVPTKDTVQVPAPPQISLFPAAPSAPSIFGNNTATTNGFSAANGSAPSFPTTNGASTTNAAPSAAFEFRVGPKPLASAPKEPSKLRYSFQPPPTPPPAADKPAEKKALFPMDPPPPPKVVLQPWVPPSTTAAPAPGPSTASSSKDPKSAARAVASSALPSYVFTVLTNTPDSSAAHVKARDAARRLDKSALPVFDFTAPPASALDKGKAKATEKAPVQGFNWGAAGVAKPPAAGASGSWTCGTCMLSNGPEVKDKCAVCEAPRPDAPKAAPAVKGFDWGAAGGAKLKGPSEGAWTCGTCMLSNGPEVKDKCAVCEAPRPAAPKAAPAVKGFDWGAAGAAKPKGASEGAWTCGTCMLSNGPEVKDKCAVCDAPR